MRAMYEYQKLLSCGQGRNVLVCKPLKSDDMKVEVTRITLAKLKDLKVLMMLHSPQSSGFPSATTSATIHNTP